MSEHQTPVAWTNLENLDKARAGGLGAYNMWGHPSTKDSIALYAEAAQTSPSAGAVEREKVPDDLLRRIRAMAEHYGRRAEIMSRYADEVPTSDPYRVVADADADSDHQKAADLRAILSALSLVGGGRADG